VEIQIHKDKIEILSFPGPMPPINQAMLKKQRVVARDYRNRKIGGFLKELKLTEGRGTGLPIIHSSMEENGSPPPVFETDENNAYFLCILPIHPLTPNPQYKSAIDETKDIIKQINDLTEINIYLSLSVSEIGDRDREAIRKEINDMTKMVLNYCTKPKSRDELFEKIGLYKNTKNFQNHIKPLIDLGWLYFTIPNKLTSRDQKYYTTDLGKKLLTIVSGDRNSEIKRIPVASSNIASVGYDKKAHILEIEFHHGAIYQYVDVPERLFEELMSSPAIGSYFMNEIKRKFEYQKK
jgi:ATP-dependent DNA helicase RecG